MKLFFIILIIAGIIISLYFIYISKISIYLTNKLPEFTVLYDGIQVEETTRFINKIKTHRDYETYGDNKEYTEYNERASMCKTEDYIVNYDGSIEPFEFLLDGEKGPIQNAIRIPNIKKNIDLIIGQNGYFHINGNKFSEKHSALTNPIAKNEIFYTNGKKLGEKYGVLTNSDAASINKIFKMEQGYLMMIADRDKPFFRSPKLWAVKMDTLETKLISDNLYPVSKRPVMCYKYDYMQGTVFQNLSLSYGELSSTLSLGVYYTGFVRHGWFGDNSHPEKSIIRIYSALFPDGKDIIEFSFNAGTIVKIDIDSKEPNRLNVITDASLPGVTGVRPVYARRWKITSKGNHKNFLFEISTK